MAPIIADKDLDLERVLVQRSKAFPAKSGKRHSSRVVVLRIYFLHKGLQRAELTNPKNVAEEAGVAVTTVARILGDKGYVAEKTSKKVMTAVEQTGYRVNLRQTKEPIQRPDTYQRLPENTQLNTCQQQPVNTFGLHTRPQKQRSIKPQEHFREDTNGPYPPFDA